MNKKIIFGVFVIIVISGLMIVRVINNKDKNTEYLIYKGIKINRLDFYMMGYNQCITIFNDTSVKFLINVKNNTYVIGSYCYYNNSYEPYDVVIN